MNPEIIQGSSNFKEYPGGAIDLEEAVAAARARISSARNKVETRSRLADWAIARVARAFDSDDFESSAIASDIYELSVTEKDYYADVARRNRMELFGMSPEIALGHLALKATMFEEPRVYPY